MWNLPRSFEEAKGNPIKVIGLDIKETEKNISAGYLDPFRWVLNRPISLEYDCGIVLSEPIRSGELVVNLN